MKYVEGLGNAMRIVESACDEGEITIIGHGKMPSAPEMLVKCAEFLVNKMGADVKLLAVVNEAVIAYKTGEVTYQGEKPCSCECPHCCEGEDEEEESEGLDLDLTRDEMEAIVSAEIADVFGFCTDEVKAEIRDITMEAIDDLIGMSRDEYDEYYLDKIISEKVYDAYGGINEDTIADYADYIADRVDDEVIWD